MGSAATEDYLPPHLQQVTRLLEDYQSSSGQISINGHDLCISDIHSFFTKKFQSASLSKEAREAIKNSFEFLQEKISEGACVYGVHTGFGGSADVRYMKEDAVQAGLVTHLKAGFGEELPPSLVKATMLVRANSISRGYSAVRSEVVDLLVAVLNKDIVPHVPKRGSVSASGDLMPTSYIAACLEGRSDCKVKVKGKDKTASEALADAGLSPVVFKGKDALGVVNASSFAAALAAEVLYKGNVAILLTQAVVAMGVEALQGRLESFHPVIHDKGLPHAGQREVARNIRNLLNGSKVAITQLETERGFRNGELRQDRYALRTSPQWLGPVLETSLESMRRVKTELNSANDNPLIDPVTRVIVHCGNFQGTSTTVAMDQFRQSMQLCGKLLFGLMSEIMDCTINNGLTPNLCGGDLNVDMGFKGTETAMASYTSELDYLTNPVSNHVLSAELRNQCVNSLALISARMSASALEIFQMQLTNILCALTQAIDLRWLKNQVEPAVEQSLNSHRGMNKVLFKLIPWYHFFCSPQDAVTKMVEELPGLEMVEKDKVLVDQLLNKMNILRDDLSSGRTVQKIAQDLGQGTRLLYLFVRETLGVRFHDGQHSLDTSLQSIFDAVKDGRLDDVLLSLAYVARGTS